MTTKTLVDLTNIDRLNLGQNNDFRPRFASPAAEVQRV
jgi:hypothetical protein